VKRKKIEEPESFPNGLIGRKLARGGGGGGGVVVFGEPHIKAPPGGEKGEGSNSRERRTLPSAAKERKISHGRAREPHVSDVGATRSRNY